MRRFVGSLLSFVTKIRQRTFTSENYVQPEVLTMMEPVILKNVDAVLNILNEHKDQHCVQNLLDVYKKTHDENVESLDIKDGRRHPLIILEGLDCSGKTTIAKVLAKNLDARIWCTPPKSVSHLRKSFDEHRFLRTAYYALGNYIAALEVATVLKQKPVVMDRYWHSTAAYALAQAQQDNPVIHKMPSEGDEIYQWPTDLFKPTYVFFLTVSEEIRLQRHERRKEYTNTNQEKLLKSNDTFRQNVLKAYDNMYEPGVRYVSSDIPVMRVVMNIMKMLSPENEN